MPLQNRVDPFGDIHAVGVRCMFTGNRGVIHDPDKRALLTRRWTSRAWIICDCGWRGLKRDVFGRSAPSGTAGWTNLFFLDEPTALAAGHRPCFTCRRPAAEAFAACVARGIGRDSIRAPEIDRLLHAQRNAAGGELRPLAKYPPPDGTMLLVDDIPVAYAGGALLAWTMRGYRRTMLRLPPPGTLVLTPPTTVAALAAGYRPEWHESATMPA